MKRFSLSLAVLIATTIKVSAQCSTFYDGFETASFGAGWTMQGGYTTTFPSSGSAVGTYHLSLTGVSGHYGGPYATFPATQVGYISYRVRTTSTTTANNYFVIGDANTTTNNGILFNYVNTTGNLRFYSGASYDYNYPISANVWYHVEIMNINWTAKTYDIYIDGILRVTGHPFRSTATTAVDRFYIYNYNNATSNYDEIIIGGSPVNATSVATNVSCFGGTNGSASVTASGGNGTYTYNWAPVGGTSATAVNLAAGSYTCTITDGNGCTGTSVVSITQPPAITAVFTQTGALCYGSSTGSASVTVTGGTPSYSYSWIPTGGTAATATGLPAGTYSCLITDANGCSVTQTVSITEPPALAITGTQTNVTCFSSCDGVASVNISGGTSPYDYNWNPSAPISPTVSNLCAGSYTCIVTDVNGCTIDMSFTLTSPPMLTATSTGTNVSCAGGSDGSSVISSTGGTAPYSYQWSPAGGNSDTATGLSAGTYACTITDANGCTVTSSVNITEPSPLVASDSVIAPLCNGGIGTVIITGTGGTSPYSGDSTYSVSAGTYLYVLTDANGCASTISVTLSDPPPLVAFISLTIDPSTCGGTDGSIDISPAGGTPGYTYLWSNSNTTEDLTGVTQGAYSCTITDNNGCTTSVNSSLNDPNPPAVTYSEPVSTICFDDASINLSSGSPAGGTWSGPGVASGVFDPSVAGNGSQVITYTYTDSLNCTSSATDAIVVDPCTGITESNSEGLQVYPNPSAGVFNVTCETGATINIYNALGSLVVSENATASQTQVDLRGFSDGVYILCVQTRDALYTQRIILSK